MSRIAGQFTRVEPRRRARQLVLGLLSDLPRSGMKITIYGWSTSDLLALRTRNRLRSTRLYVPWPRIAGAGLPAQVP